jgi:hypothetical protein
MAAKARLRTKQGCLTCEFQPRRLAVPLAAAANRDRPSTKEEMRRAETCMFGVQQSQVARVQMANRTRSCAGSTASEGHYSYDLLRE